MSANIIVYFPYVDNYKELLENNLLITFDDKGYQEDYQIRDSFFSRFFDALSDTTAIVYGAYYAKDQWLRHIYFDIIRALNLKDIWIFNEMIVYHYYDESNPIPSFYDFLKYIEENGNEIGGIKVYEYNLSDLEYDDEGWCTNYHSVCHDSFTDCFQEVKEIEDKYNVIVIGLHKFDQHYIRVLRENSSEVELLDPSTGEFKPFNK
ncbi:MAG: hypothetical protein J6Y24_13005 [Bacteroidales bacterium]|nr:hypothetical protein [Bacteroidales bacterium]